MSPAQSVILDRLAELRQELLDNIDGGDECRGRDSWLSSLIRDVEDIEIRVRLME